MFIMQFSLATKGKKKKNVKKTNHSNNNLKIKPS